VNSITNGAKGRTLAITEREVARFGEFNSLRGKTRSFVGTVAEGLLGGSPAGTPPIFTGLQLEDGGPS